MSPIASSGLMVDIDLLQVPSEIHTIETRSAGQAITVSVNFLFSFVIGQSFLSMLCHMRVGATSVSLLHVIVLHHYTFRLDIRFVLMLALHLRLLCGNMFPVCMCL